MKNDKPEERKEVLEDQNKEFKIWPITRPFGIVFYDEYLSMLEEAKKIEEK